MPDADFVIFQGDTASVLSRVLRDDVGDPVDLALAEVAFRMRSIDGGELVIDAEASNDQVGTGEDGSKGSVSYSWTTADTDEWGWFDAHFVVTFGGGEIQTYPNAGAIRVFVVPGDPRVGHEYVTVSSLKQTLLIQSGAVYADDDIRKTVLSCSRVIDGLCDTRFYIPDESNPEERYFTARSPDVLYIDHLVGLESVAIDRSGTGDHSEEWIVDVDFVLEPLNAPLDGRPYDRLRPRAKSLPVGVLAGVEIVGTYGWAETPSPIVDATTILARRILERKRMAPLGVVAVGVDAATRIARSDPDVLALIKGYEHIRKSLRVS